jgi:DNA transformation protein and related proteins
MGKLCELPNIGRKLEEQLISVGIDSAEKLKEVGSKEAWLRIKEIDFSACYNRLCALEGAIQNIRWFYLDDKTKDDLRNFYQAQKQDA